MGIDGYTFLEKLPVQVKQVERVGRPEIDSFQNAVRREGKHKGYIIGFGFTRGAGEEAARVEQTEGLEIALVKVSSILDNPLDSDPRPGLDKFAFDLLESARQAVRAKAAMTRPSIRLRDTLPTAEEIVASAIS